MDKQFIQQLKAGFFRFAYIAFVLTSCFFMLEYSSESAFAHVFSMQIQYILLNILTIGILWVIFQIICNRIWLSGLLCAAVCSMIAVVNHYVIMYHGTPLSFTVLRDFGTAMAVVSSYSFSIDIHIAVILFFFLIAAEASVLARRHFTVVLLQHKMRWACNGFLAIFSACVLFFGYFSSNPIKPPHTIAWLWSEAYNTYGYSACSLESFLQNINTVNEPEGYSSEAVSSIEISPTGTDAGKTPDIILILNETFYDLSRITDPNTDIPYLQNIASMDNLLRGYAVVPSVGGGTNTSEYELLTSNSTQLMPGVTPFNALDLTNANSIVRHLNALGYYTIGTHSENAANYMRGTGYPALGFRETHFDEEFISKEYFHDNYHETDQSLYNNLIRWYEESPADTPRFLYLLTIQNHAGYENNSSEFDLVHTQNDYGTNTPLVNEFLTDIYLSDQAFSKLTHYFATVDRPVILCMVGDHCPNFAPHIADPIYTAEERELLLREVPLLIWANYPLEDMDLGTMSLNYVIPTLLDMAEVKLSPYYSYLLEAKESVPILSAYGRYFDPNGNMFRYDSDAGSAYETIVDNYFYLEYHNLLNSRNQQIFDPYR